MQWLIVSLISLAMTLGGLAARAAGDTKAEQLLAQARAALGGEKNLSKVQGLTASGTYQRTMQDRQLSGEITIELQLPDKMLRTETMNPMGDMTVVTEQGINGEKLLRSQRSVNAPPGAVIRMGPPPAGDAEAQAIRNARADFARTVVALLLTAPSSVPLEYAYGGEAESDEGKADVVDAKGPGSFAARIFLDQKNHRPLMLQYRGVAPQMRIQTQRVDGPPDPARIQRAEQAAAGAPPPPLVDITLFLDDYKPVDGVLLPHHLSRSIDGKLTEEMTFKTIRINPAFKPDTFSAR
ncbi:MAG TPA: hypothetical protein VEP46_18290 [Vicinamibacterales bacterium]|nr:hypothetical protein [Vicinamibacterales bacterium]